VPIRTIPNTTVDYALVTYDRDGVEQPEDLTSKLLDRIRAEDITDVFFQSHGWKGDVPAAIDQYDRWFKAFIDLHGDVGRMERKAGGTFRPLRVGLHWPSLPWGNEELGDGSFSVLGAMPVGDDLLQTYLDRLGDTPKVRKALKVIIDEARNHAAELRLTPEAEEAYRELNGELGMGEDGENAAPGDDREPFDPQEAVESADDVTSFGLGNSLLGGVLAPLRQLSFWKMKDRGRRVGEGEMHDFVRAVQKESDVRVHLMGHSFGCIVVSAIVNGPKGGSGLSRPVDSLVLVQGALSIWSYASQLPNATDRAGYFHDVIGKRRVVGPIVTTQSQYDAAVGQLYPWAAGVRLQVAFDPQVQYPKYAALGAFGIRGLTDGVDDRQMMPHTVEYGFLPGKIYNLESSRYIRFGDGVSGAHNDIDGLEVAHAVWQAALASVGAR
jgi:hypothetical protein